MNALLIPVEFLIRVAPELDARIARSRPAVPSEAGDIGDALRWALLFERWPELLGHGHLDAPRAFYNRYYWLRRFAVLKQRRDGYDAGLEQKLFAMLEHPGFEVDWLLLEQLDHEANT